jgi:hypothetical protein
MIGDLADSTEAGWRVHCIQFRDFLARIQRATSCFRAGACPLMEGGQNFSVQLCALVNSVRVDCSSDGPNPPTKRIRRSNPNLDLLRRMRLIENLAYFLTKSSNIDSVAGSPGRLAFIFTISPALFITM